MADYQDMFELRFLEPPEVGFTIRIRNAVHPRMAEAGAYLVKAAFQKAMDEAATVLAKRIVEQYGDTLFEEAGKRLARLAVKEST